MRSRGGHSRNKSPWLPIGPFRVWLRAEAERAGSANKLCDELDLDWNQLLRYLKINRWVPLQIVDEIMTKRHAMWTDIYDHDDAVSSATARGLPRVKEGTDGNNSD